MVTDAPPKPKPEPQPTTALVKVDPRRRLQLIAEELEVPLVIRPWWGSVRAEPARVHTVCGDRIFWPRPPYGCFRCGRRDVPPNEVRVVPQSHRWLCPCPGYNQIKWPEVQGGTVVLWEGRCGHKTVYHGRHKHHQVLEILDIGPSAFLLRITVGNGGRHFLIGTEDGHPFVTAIKRSMETVPDAFDWMMPTYVRKAVAAGKDVKRQGDWFFVPRSTEPRGYRDAPGVGYILRNTNPPTYRAVMCRGAHLRDTRHTASYVIYINVLGVNDESPVVKGTVESPDHPPVELVDWHVAVQRRASPGPFYGRTRRFDD